MSVDAAGGGAGATLEAAGGSPSGITVPWPRLAIAPTDPAAGAAAGGAMFTPAMFVYVGGGDAGVDAAGGVVAGGSAATDEPSTPQGTGN